jgi:hypothetical protein
MDKIERPNTVSGLNAKRDQLIAYRKRLQADIKKVTIDIDHLEAAIALFDPSQTPAATKRYLTRHRAKKGSVKTFILSKLRDAPRPMTSAQITDLWLAERGLRADDATRVVIRKRIGAALISARAAGTVRNEGVFEGHKGWTVA